jgi:PAS domain-containing protein
MLDSAGLISLWNRGVQDLLGYTANDVLGQALSVFVVSDSNVQSPAPPWVRMAEESGFVLFDTHCVQKDGVCSSPFLRISDRGSDSVSQGPRSCAMLLSSMCDNAPKAGTGL